MRKRWLLALPLLLATVVLVDREPTGAPPHRAQYLPAGDVGLRVVAAGRGDTTLILFHGYAESLMAWRPTFDLLAARTRVMAMDLPGFGLSDKPPGSYDLAGYRRRMAAFLDDNTTGPVILVGHSMGGEIAAALALDRPDRVVGLVLIATAGYGLGATAEVVTTDGRSAVGWFNAAVGEFVVPLHDPEWLSEPVAWMEYDPLLDPAYRFASSEVLRVFDFGALRTRFQEIRQPTLVIWGRQDPTIPFAYGEAIDRAIPCSSMVAVKRTLHRPHQTEPDLVAGVILGFLDHPPECG